MECGDTPQYKMQRALYDAVKTNDLDDLERLHRLAAVANKHWREFPPQKAGDSLLHIAVREGHLDIVRYLCEEWTDGDLKLEVSNNLGKKVLHDAAQTCNQILTDYLIRKGAEVNSLKTGDWTPLMLAATKKGPSAFNTIRNLLSCGADPLLKNKDGWTALHIACREGDIRIVDELINHGVEAITATSYNGRTPLHVAALHGHADVVRRLLQENSCFKDPVDACGLTPLMESVRGGHMKVIRILLEYKADVNKCDKLGRKCSHLAAETGHADVLEFLVPNLLPVVEDPSTKGLTPLHCAVRCGQIRCARLLLSLGAHPLRPDFHGRNSLDFCYGMNNPQLHELLSSVANMRPFPGRK